MTFCMLSSKSCLLKCNIQQQLQVVIQRRGYARIPKFKYFHVIECAKGGKKGGGKKGGKKKGEGSLMNTAIKQQKGSPWLATDSITYLLLLVESYKRQVGKPLLEGIDITQIAQGVWEAPFALLSHDPTEEGKPYIYVNQGGLQALDCQWDDVVGKSSIEEGEEAIQRQQLLDETLEKGSLIGSEIKWRNKAGALITIPELSMFNVTAPDGEVVGQAVVMDKWEYEDGSIGTVGAPAAKPPTQQHLQIAEDELNNMKSFIRDLKENQGFTNQDEEVQQAVARMQEQKKLIEKLHELLSEDQDNGQDLPVDQS
eukprot:TRINITY_DN10883_c0_g2_i5.p1 TRINITY_DN10883_c0_g2~~TRINITY_DN10883_c0_g2_i5.p1  ORF type:complete len:312 (-),score=71.09 TRINITY_DN10883_c0_g2_i5:137-1072(-)